MKYGLDTNTVYHEFSYNEPDREKQVENDILIRKWEDTDWHEPTVDYMGIEDTKLCGKMPYFNEPNFFKETEVKIGNQIWMNKNLNVGDCGEGIYFNKDNGEYYYTWDAAKRIADKIRGWHLPSREEWDELVEATGNDAANLRAESWKGTDIYGFSAVPAGYWSKGFYYACSYAYFWTSESDGSRAWHQLIDAGTSVYESNNIKYDGFSVRLVKDK